jgi:hypothetical protein
VIAHELRSIFVHVPRTAGQSIEQRLLAACGVRREHGARYGLRPNRDPRSGPPRLAHLTIGEYVAAGHVMPQQAAAWFTFAFVRNPWERVVSEFLFHHRHRCDFKTFLFDRWPRPEDDDFDRGLAFHRHVLPQSRFVTDARGDVAVDFIGRFEALDRDFALVCDRIGIGSAPLAHRNSWRRWQDRWIPWRVRQATRPYAAYFDAESRRRVAALYAEDIERFGYRFPGTDAPSRSAHRR